MNYSKAEKSSQSAKPDNSIAWHVTYKDIKHAAPGVARITHDVCSRESVKKHNEITLVFGGEAGQGLQTITQILSRMFVLGGMHVFAVSEFMSRIRGGSNSVTLRIANHPVRALVEKIDFCVLLDADALPRLRGRCSAETQLIGEPKIFVDEAGMLPLPLMELCSQCGGILFGSSIVCGYIARMAGWDLGPLDAALARSFSDRKVLEKNCTAAQLGWKYGAVVEGLFAMKQGDIPADRLLMDGSQAVALGALAGGCNFISSYPMSPSTGVLINLAKLAHAHGVVVEQAEDEISAVNMGLGSWYAGGRAMVSTSGGGFDLMAEGISLAGIIESPMVIHLAQRPGPGTGLPTRTEQGDLEIARYSGHGEFPRAILAPGSPEDAFVCAAHAFTMADASQSPVFILTDQYLLDTLTDLEPFELPDVSPLSLLTITPPDYQRYAYGPDGVSPRGIPGLGAGFVCADSDEHGVDGHITEDFNGRIAMVDKRLDKMRLLKADLALAPRLYGSADYYRLIVGWGSVEAAVVEALEKIQSERTAFLHCRQLYPVTDEVIAYLKNASQVIVIENNATGQFARLLQAETGCTIFRKWLKYNGLAFTVDEVGLLLLQEVEI